MEAVMPHALLANGEYLALGVEAAAILNLLDEARRRIDQDVDAAKKCIDRAAALVCGRRANQRSVFDFNASARSGLVPWQMRRIVRHIDVNLANPISTEDLADLVRLSRGYFSKAFGRSFGLSPHRYVIGCRIERAKTLMVDGDESLSQISAACGLRDQAHLSRLFRQATGHTPHQWRCEQRQLIAQSSQATQRLVDRDARAAA
jgi:AraC family transcriptional regulator